MDGQTIAGSLPDRVVTAPPARVAALFDAHYERLYARTLLWHALEALHPRRRAVLVPHELEGMKAAAVAALLGISVVPVRWHLSRRRHELTRILGPAMGGARDAVDPDSGRPIYLDPEVVLTNRDVTETRVVALPGGFGVEVHFTDVGAAKLRSATSANLGRQLAIIVDGQVLAAPTIRSPVAQIGVMGDRFTREDAERLADGIRRR